MGASAIVGEISKERDKKRERPPLPKRSLTVEFYVGLFALMGVLAFGYLAINIAQMRFFSSGFYEIVAEFTNVSGLELGAPVEIAGVPVGEVKSIELSSTSARVILEIRNDVQIREDDIAAVRTKGIIGDRFVKISPGSEKQYVKAGGEIINTESVVELEEVIGKIIHRME